MPYGYYERIKYIILWKFVCFLCLVQKWRQNEQSFKPIHMPRFAKQVIKKYSFNEFKTIDFQYSNKSLN